MSLIDSKWLKDNNYHLFHYEPMGNGKEGVVEVDADTIPTTWIPISKRLPETDELMLVIYNNPREHTTSMWIGWHEMENVWFIDGCEHCKEIGNEVLAWMPLPEVPKGVSE